MKRIKFNFGTVAAVLVSASLFGSMNAARAETTAQASLRANVVKFAQSKLGSKVDLGQGGECTELINAALKQHGGQPVFHRKTMVVDHGKPGWNPSYGWGTHVQLTTKGNLVGTIKNMKPGYIIQFEKVEFSKSGNWKFPHHTAIVESVNGTKVTLLHQNVDGGVRNGFPSVVRRQTIDFAGKTNGGYSVWSPLPK